MTGKVDTELARAPECAEITGLLRDGARWVTVWGTAGAGKSRVVEAIAASAPDQGFESAIVCRLEGVHTGQQLYSRLAERLVGVPETAKGGSRPRQLAAALASLGKVLLVLDGFEALTEIAAETLEGWLKLAPELVLLVSSRRRCGSSQERAFELGPLTTERGIRLFEAHFERSWGQGASVDTLDPDVVRDIVESMDGVPLAIEAAAAAAGLLGGSHVSIEQLLHIEAGRGRQTLSRVLEISWSLLTEPQRRTLAQLSVFEREFTLDDARAVVDMAEGSDVIAHLLALREFALLRARGSGRFSLLSTERVIAQEKLSLLDPDGATRVRHAAHYLRRASAERAFPEEQAAALKFVLSRRLEGWLPDAERALIGLERTFAREGRGDELSDLTEATVAWARDVGACDSATACVLRLRGVRRRCRGLFAQATEDLEAAIEMAAATGADHSAARAATELAATELAMGRGGEARRRFEQALEHAASCKETTCAADAYRQLADAVSLSGQLDEALELRARAWELARGDPHLAARASAALAIESLSAGDLDAFERVAAESFAELRELGDIQGMGILLVNIGVAEAMRGRSEEAICSFRDAVRHLRVVGDVGTEASATLNIAWMKQERDPSLGLHELEVGYELARQSGVLWMRLLASAGLALVYASVGRRGQYEVMREKAEGLLEEVELPSVTTSARLRLLAAELAAEKRHGDARASTVDRRARAALHRSAGDEAILVQSACRVLERTREWQPGEETSNCRAIARVLVAEACEWFRPPSGDWVDLRKRKTLRAVLGALVESPGVGATPERLIAAGWPDEKILPKAAQARVHVAISSLRKLGLPVLRNPAGAYVIDPAFAVVTGYQAQVRFERAAG